MTLFNARALHGANDPARADRMRAADDLVRRTLSQHGLMPGGEGAGAQAPAFGGGMPDFGGLPSFGGGMPDFSGLPGMAGAVRAVEVPEGASFEGATYACEAGSRAYRVYVPSTVGSPAKGVVVMLHGCTQTPEDFAIGTGMNALAEAHGFVVVYPAQSRGDNAQSCWNWFSRGDQRRGRGEPAILAGLTREVAARHGVPAERTFVAGLSAGAAMAVILGETYGDVFSAVGVHSGLPYGSAKDVASAFAAMAGNGAEAPTQRGSQRAARAIVFHGTADATVRPVNAERIVRDARGPGQTVEVEDRLEAGGYGVTRQRSTGEDGVAVLESWTVDGLGHAWSGGQSGGSYTDPKGPDASAEMIRFFFENTDKDE